jgi:hypothetical protein
MDEKHEQFLYGSMLCILNAALSRAEDSRKKGFVQFADVHTENAIGAYTLWVAVGHDDFVKKHQNEILDRIYH